MSFYFNDDKLNAKVRTLLGNPPKPVGVVHSDVAGVAQEILRSIEPQDVVVRNGVMYIGTSTSTYAKKKLNPKEIGRVEEQISAESVTAFGARADVVFSYNGEMKIDTEIGGRETVHCYSMAITIPCKQ